MNWLFFAFIPPVANALVNHIDKYLISRFIKGRGIGSLVIFSAFMGLPTALLIAILKPDVIFINPQQAFILILNGSLFMAGITPYLYALEKDETSVVSPLSQITTIISYILGLIFLKETLSLTHFVAFLFIICGALLLTIEKHPQQKIKIKTAVLFLMFLSSFFLAVNGLIFKVFALSLDFWTTTFWEYIGFVAFATAAYTFVKSYRVEFLRLLQTNRQTILGVNILNEILAIVGKTALHFATLTVPLSLVFLVAEGFQPFFVLLFGIIITLWFPKIAEENISKIHLLQKVGAIILLFLGTYLIQ